MPAYQRHRLYVVRLWTLLSLHLQELLHLIELETQVFDLRYSMHACLNMRNTCSKHL